MPEVITTNELEDVPLNHNHIGDMGVEEGLLIAFSVVNGSYTPTPEEKQQVMALLKAIVEQRGCDAEGGIDIGQRDDRLTSVMSMAMFG